ncbi:hypothetical protein M5585_16110 [Serratia ureilytica]
MIIGWLMDRMNPHKVVAVGYLLTGLFVGIIGFVYSYPPLMAITVFIAGTCMNGAQSSMPARRPDFTPPRAGRPAWHGCSVSGVLAAFWGR